MPAHPSSHASDDGPAISPGIGSLAVEMLARCFVFLPTDFHKRLTILHVSRRWRITAHGFPEIWAQIHVTKPSGGMHHLVGKVLALHPGYPFDVLAVPGKTWMYNLGMPCVLAEHIHHLRSLDLPKDWDVTVLGRAAAPMLERLSCDAVNAIPINFLGGQVGRLRELTLRDLRLPDAPCPALETVTHLTTAIRDGISYGRATRNLFAQFPKLQHLDLAVQIDDANWLPPGPAPASLVHLRLTRLRVPAAFAFAYFPIDLLAVAQSWRTPNLASMDVLWDISDPSAIARIGDGARELAVTHAAGPQHEEDLVQRLAVPENDGEFSRPRHQDYIVRAQHADGAQRYTAILDSSTAAEIAQVLADHVPVLALVRRLSLASQVLHKFVTLAGPGALPSLEELRVEVWLRVEQPQDERLLRPFTSSLRHMPVADADASPTSAFPWVHLARLPLAKHVEVDVRATRRERFLASTADAEALVSVLRSACASSASSLEAASLCVSIHISGFLKEVVDGIELSADPEHGPLIVFL